MAERILRSSSLKNSETSGSASSADAQVLTEAFASPAMRRVFELEAPIIYSQSLTALGVTEKDVERSVRRLRETPIRKKQLEAVYGSQKAANSHRNGNGNSNNGH